jgi:AcrR family transcriptional regulator
VAEPSSEERARLIRAAWTVVRRSGFDGVKVQLVMKEAGLSARTFYRHFPDKDSLLIALIEDEYGAASRRLRQAVADAPDEPAAQVAAWIREMLLAADDPARAPRTRLFSSYHLLMGRFPGVLIRSTQMILDPLENSIRQGQERGEFGGDDPHPDAQQVGRLAAGALTEYLAGAGESPEIEVLIDSTARFALRALRGRSDRQIGLPPLNRFNK